MTEAVDSVVARICELMARGEEDINDEFEIELDRLAALDGERVPDRMMSLFDDNYVWQDLLWEVLHKLENKVKDQEYVDAYTRVMSDLHEKAPEWCETILSRMLNSAHYQSIIKSRLKVMTQDHISTLRLQCINLMHHNKLQFGQPVGYLFSDLI